ncbi:FapA family protein [Halalkalibacter alkaliphilus]|uniref:FapA family protein n=1 Tax=Halalkalibacter alkaliphilus TaxID=2917993 RepID=A0A9X2CPX4_9BACI|nr:FapA family protein [Halalkalibacter alkaliphilus]MCL7746712.1 FapA family protein [Halalkalibacter alkaliphilus]
MQSIVSKGKNINEAIDLGLSLLETSKKNVNIEIIQYEAKGFLGIRSKEAIVKLTKLNPGAQEVLEERGLLDNFELLEEAIAEIPDEKVSFNNEPLQRSVQKETTDDLSGKVWVEDGRLYCKASPEHFPMITVPKGIQVIKNNQVEKKGTLIVSEKDTFELKVESETKETKWDVSMDSQKVKVLLHVEPGYRLMRSIPDIEPDKHIKLSINEVKEIDNSLSYSKVIHKLENLRVKHGFNQDEIVKALETTEAGTFEIATGIHAKQGKDGWIEMKVNTDMKVGPKEQEDGSVDFRETRAIPTVERGQVIAIIHPPTPGQHGYTVTNEPLPAKQTFPIQLKLGKGVDLVDDKIVSTDHGRPHIEKRGQLVKASIMPKLTHSGDVDISSGNIHFIGDVEVLGRVEEGMTIEAEGDITIRKEVNRSTLTSSGAIIADGNIVNSEISAGKNNMLIAELGHILGILHQHIENMVTVINQLTHAPAFKNNDVSVGGIQPLIRILMERKFKSFPPLAKKYVEVVRKGEEYLDDDEWRNISVHLNQLFLSISNELVTVDKIIELSAKMKELHELSKTPVEPDSYIVAPSVSNSRLYCSGNVEITGQGCVNTKIHAGGTLSIRGIIRGGEVYGRLGATINEVGSEVGTPTVIAVPYDQEIQIGKALEGTTIKIGNIKHVFTEVKYHVHAFLDKEERIVFK